MTSIRHSLRFRLAITFALFGSLVSLLLSIWLSFAAHSLGERLMDETLGAEIEDYISRHSHNPNAMLPATITIRGYALVAGRGKGDIPPDLRNLAPGKHQLTLDSIPYRVAVVDKGGERYVMMFNETQQLHREQTFLIYLAIGAFIMILASAGVGWWLAGRVVAPVAELARRVSMASPENETIEVDHGFPDNEIGKLAKVFAGYLRRMRAFIDRERAFTADVSHEIRTPLAIVQGVVELMEDDTHLCDKQKERIVRIGRATREMADMTSALLLMAREEGADGAVGQSCDVSSVVSDIVETHRHLVSTKTTVELVCRSHPRIAAERTLFAIVVANLIRNAFTYTESGTVSILVDEGGLEIVDTGSGISGEEIGKVFERHFKGAGSTGAGIGLSLVKRICDKYGWKTIIESKVGYGTSVRLIYSSPDHLR